MMGSAMAAMDKFNTDLSAWTDKVFVSMEADKVGVIARIYKIAELLFESCCCR